MNSPVELLGIYLHLARASAQRKRPLVRDRLLFLAATLSAELGLPAVAACCRARVLAHNPGHLLHYFPTVEEGLATEDFESLRRQNLRRYSPEKAEQLMQSLRIDWQAERAAYYNDEEYAAALLGLTVDDLHKQYGS